MLPAHLIKQLSPASAKLYLIFLTLSDQDALLPLIHASLTKLARASGFSERTCQRAVNQLLRLHILRRLPRGLHTPHSYVFLPIPESPPTTPPVSTSPPNTTPMSTSTPSTTTPMSTLPSPTTSPDPKNPNTTPMSNSSPSIPTPHTSPMGNGQSEMGNPHSPFSIVLNICSGNFLALPPELRKMPHAQLDSLFFHLYSQLTPQEQAQAFAAAQASLARQSPETLQKAQEMLHAT